MRNVYFELTREFNRSGPIAALASGQAVVFYRVAIMSKDGDWVLKETPEACERVLEVLSAKSARYRPGAPLDVRWLSGGWSSHFQFEDEKRRRVRCDFFTRPPRVPAAAREKLFDGPETETGSLLVVDLESLIRMKQTQRAKDYPPIAELARRLPPEAEIEFTTDPDRILALAPGAGEGSSRPPVRAARAGGSRGEVVVALAREVDNLQTRDRTRLEGYQRASEVYLREFRRAGLSSLELREAHAKSVEIASKLLPQTVGPEDGDADAQ